MLSARSSRKTSSSARDSATRTRPSVGRRQEHRPDRRVDLGPGHLDQSFAVGAAAELGERCRPVSRPRSAGRPATVSRPCSCQFLSKSLQSGPHVLASRCLGARPTRRRCRRTADRRRSGAALRCVAWWEARRPRPKGRRRTMSGSSCAPPLPSASAPTGTGRRSLARAASITLRCAIVNSQPPRLSP